MKRIHAASLVLVLAIFVLPAASAHTPLDTGGNGSPETATLVNDPAKSWAIYGELEHAGGAQYYRFDVPQGGRISLQMFIPTDDASIGFLPGLALMGPGIVPEGDLPDTVEIPEGLTAIAVAGVRPPEATFEPFSPGAFVELARIDTTAPETGTYYVAVHSQDRGGRFGLALGYVEAFTVTEWITTPLSLLGIYAWQGENVLLILVPILVPFAVAFPLLRRRWGAGRSPTAWAALLAGLLFISTAALILTQLGYASTQAAPGVAALVPIVLATSSLLLGFFTVRLALRTTGEPDRKTRLRFATYGVLALIAWSGFVVGPFAALVAAVLPARLPALRRAGVKDEA